MIEPIENVPAWGNAGQILNERGIKWDYAIIDQITKRNPYTHTNDRIDCIFVHFMIDGYREVAMWSPVFNMITFFEPHRLWADYLVKACRHLGSNKP
jgi:hypothetical protein